MLDVHDVSVRESQPSSDSSLIMITASATTPQNESGTPQRSVILASTSSYRPELLARLRIDFEVMSTHAG